MKKKKEKYILPKLEALRKISDTLGKETLGIAKKAYKATTEPIGRFADDTRDFLNKPKSKQSIEYSKVIIGSLTLARLPEFAYLVGRLITNSNDNDKLSGTDNPSIKEYLIKRVISENAPIWGNEIKAIIDEICQNQLDSIMRQEMREFRRNVRNRKFIIKLKDGETKEIKEEEAIRIYGDYLNEVNYNSRIRNMISGFIQLSLEVNSIKGEISGADATKEFITKAVVHLIFNRFNEFLKNVTLEDSIENSTNYLDGIQWENFLNSTEPVSEEEEKQIIENINDVKNKFTNSKYQSQAWELMSTVLCNTIESVINGRIIYKKLQDRIKGKKDITANEIINIILEIISDLDKADDASENIKGIMESLINIGKIFSKRENEEWKQLQEQVDSIKNLNYPKKHIKELVIKKGMITPINRRFVYNCCSDIKIIEGDIIGLDGDTGSGKSSLIRTMILGEPKSKGFMLADGEETDRLYEQSVFYGIEKTKILDGSILTKITSKKNPSEDDRRLVKELLDDVGFPAAKEILDSEDGISSGEDERVLIARILYRIVNDKKSIVFLDEPIGKVPEELRDLLMKTIANCAKKYGIIILVTSHVAQLDKYCNRIVAVENTLPDNIDGLRTISEISIKDYKKKKISQKKPELLK